MTIGFFVLFSANYNLSDCFDSEEGFTFVVKVGAVFIDGKSRFIPSLIKSFGIFAR